jgi:5-methylcytosine-specific restriction endonuclease McrA
MLKAEIEGIGIPTKGTPQGGILSPLLSNIVLNELDWWISNQFETFQTKHKYAIHKTNNSESHKFRALRTNSKLKEIYILRYADDFKLFCATKNMAKKIYKATELWLKERLGLEISPEKSKIVDVRKSSSEFLGFQISTQPPRTKRRARERKYVVESHLTDKAKNKCKRVLKKKVNDIQKSPSPVTTNKYNSTVLGIQNYYKVATHVNIDMQKIAFIINKSLFNRLKKIWSKTGVKSKTYKRFYKNNYATHFIGSVAIFPLADISTTKPIRFTQIKCNYTQDGRQLIHDELNKRYNHAIIRHLMSSSYSNNTVELNDNKITKYIAQYGKCSVTGTILSIGNMEIHHILPVSLGGTDIYDNLIWVTHTVHELIHATIPATIHKYRKMLNLTPKGLQKINDYRLKAGNFTI